MQLPQMQGVTRAVSDGEHGRYQANDGVIMCVHSAQRWPFDKGIWSDSIVAALRLHSATWARSDESLQKDSELCWVLGRTQRCQGAGGEVLLAIVGTNYHALQKASIKTGMAPWNAALAGCVGLDLVSKRHGSYGGTIQDLRSRRP